MVRSQAPRAPPVFVVAKALLVSPEKLIRPGTHLISRRSLPGMLHTWARAGSHRFPDDPSYAFALLQDPGRAGKISPWRSCRCCPRATQAEGLNEYNLEANTGLQHPLSTLHERRRRLPCKTRFRLAGCASTGRGSNPLDRFERFQVTSHSPFQDFSCRKGGLAQIVPQNATEKLWKIFLEFLMIISNPETSLEEDRVAVDNWSRDNLQNVADSVTDVENAFDIGVSYGLIHSIYEWLDQAESQYTQSWLFLQNRVENILASKPSTREDADMMKHVIANLPSISR